MKVCKKVIQGRKFIAMRVSSPSPSVSCKVFQPWPLGVDFELIPDLSLYMEPVEGGAMLSSAVVVAEGSRKHTPVSGTTKATLLGGFCFITDGQSRPPKMLPFWEAALYP